MQIKNYNGVVYGNVWEINVFLEKKNFTQIIIADSMYCSTMIIFQL